MADGVTQQALSRLSHLPGSTNPADMIAAQKYYDVEFMGGTITGLLNFSVDGSFAVGGTGDAVFQQTGNMTFQNIGFVAIQNTGDFLIAPTGVFDANPGTTGRLDNVSIGERTPQDGAFSTLVANDVAQFAKDAIIGIGTIPTNSVADFLWVPVCAGAPSGNPTPPYSGAVALVYDSTDNKLYARVAGAWKSVALT